MCIRDRNSTVTDFRNAALLAAITILFVTLMGLIGYINDEIQRRSKEESMMTPVSHKNIPKIVPVFAPLLSLIHI